jgi:aspartate-semialdehyde dehydrogenase
MTTYTVAVVGATGNVGREMLAILAEREFPVGKVHAIASRSSLGKEVSFGMEAILKVETLDDFDFSNVDIALFSPGSQVSKVFAPKAAAAGAFVIDNTSYFRMQPDVPLLVPEVNPETMELADKRRIIANPNCVALPLVMVLKPIHDLAHIKRVVVTSFQSVSGAGKKAMDELYSQTKSRFLYQEPEPTAFAKPIAFNVLPMIGEMNKDGSTQEEEKVAQETQKMLDPEIQVAVSCVRVPIFVGHSMAVTIECTKPCEVEEVIAALVAFPGVRVQQEQDPSRQLTPIDIVGEDDVFVSRIRKDPTVPYGLQLWIVSDNLRKGAALNAVQIAEQLVAEGYV